ncbi:hypothetical protein INR49_004382 [Caranx melampygus]|nr:hypothetical protein INR49_004382 [Caranx melampygus]
MVPDEDEEDYKVTQADTHRGSFLVDQDSLAVVNDKALAERTDLPLSKPNNTPPDSDLSQQEPSQFQSFPLRDQGEPDSVAESGSTTDQTEVDQSDPLKGSVVVQEDETKPAELPQSDQSKSETPTTEELEPAPTDRTEAQMSPQHETQLCTEEGQGEQQSIALTQQPKKDEATTDIAQDPAPVQPGHSVSQDSSKDQATSEISDPNGTSILTSSSATDEIQQESPADTSTKAPTAPSSPTSNQPSKPAASAANPFKIQKVKSSDLKSFNPILNEEETGNVAWNSSLETGLNLSVPVESLEIISDSEEGDATATTVLPDWLKEGEFVTVGTNKSGTVRYVGPTDFAKGTWVGVELEVPAGKNDGSVGGKHYFHCNPGYGVLVRPDRVTRGGAKRRRQQQKRRSANLSGSSPNLAALTALAKGEPGAAAAGRSRGENRKSWNT